VAGQMVVGEGDGGAGAAIIDFVAPGGRDAQRAGGDVGGSGGGRVKGVIGSIGSRHADAADTDAPGGAGILAGEGSGRVAGSQGVTGHAVVRQAHCGAGRTVIHLVGAGGRYVQGAGSDVGDGVGGGIGRVVGRIGAGNRDA